jgi:hypothetical protein
MDLKEIGVNTENWIEIKFVVTASNECLTMNFVQRLFNNELRSTNVELNLVERMFNSELS